MQQAWYYIKKFQGNRMDVQRDINHWRDTYFMKFVECYYVEIASDKLLKEFGRKYI